MKTLKPIYKVIKPFDTFNIFGEKVYFDCGNYGEFSEAYDIISIDNGKNEICDFKDCKRFLEKQ